MSVASITTLSDVRAILAPGTRLVLWPRDLQADVGAWLDQLPADRLPQGRVLVAPGETSEALRRFRDTAGTPEGPECNWLMRDIVDLVAEFSRVSGSGRVDLRLEVIHHDACWRFHYDMVPFRLVTTYRGPGTQWVRPDEAEAALRDQRAYTGPLQALSPGHVACFKGARSPDGGIVHRSPPMGEGGGARLFLCLNVPSAVSPEPFQGPAP